MKSVIDALLVENSSSDAELVKKIINLANVNKPVLHHVRRFREALNILEFNTFDIILLDLHLPDGEGVYLVKQLKKLVPQIPIVALTGSQDQMIIEAALQEGVQDYVVKPDVFSPIYLEHLGYAHVGNQLIQRIQHAIRCTKLCNFPNQDQERYALIAEGTNDGIWDWDLKTNSVYYSSQWKSLLGLEHDAISHSPDEWLSRIHTEDRDYFEEKLHNYLLNHTPPFQCEYRIRHQNGHYLWVLTRGKAMWDQSGIAYRIVGCQTDITIQTPIEQTPEPSQDIAQQDIAQRALYSVAIGILSNLATLYLEQEQSDEALPILEATLMMRKWLLGDSHIDVMANVYQLATLYDNQGQYKKAKSLYQEALSLFEKNLGAHHPTTNLVRLKVLLINRMNEAIGI